MRIKRRMNARCTYVHFLVFLYFGYICCYKPFCSLSVRSSVFVCIDLFLLSLTLGLIHSSAGQRERAFGILKEMSQLSPVKQILYLTHLQRGGSRDARRQGWSENMLTFEPKRLITGACFNAGRRKLY